MAKLRPALDFGTLVLSVRPMAALTSKRDTVAGGGAETAIIAAIIVSLMYFGRDVLLPIALAILLSFVLAPLVRALQNWWIPRAFSVIAVVLLSCLALFVIGGMIAVEATQLAGNLPRYKSTIDAKISSLRTTITIGGPLARAAAMLEDLGREVSRPVAAGMNALSMAQSPERAKEPVPVEVREVPAGPFERLSNVITGLLHPLATTGITFIYAIFILLQREDLRNRVIKLAGARDLHKTTAALDDAGRRLSRLLLTQLSVNVAFGAAAGTGLWIIGVPSPMLWGILSAILRFIPYIGAMISGLFPLTLAVAVEPGWSKAILTGLLYVSLDAFVGNLIEPLLYGRTSGLSPFALVVSATFWTFLWGPVGLVLAAPMTICLVVMGRHVERLKFLDVMLGDEPPLSPPEVFYQRMLAGDPAEEIDRAETLSKEHTLISYFDDVALKGLKLAQIDLSRGYLDPSRLDKIRAAVGELMDELAEQQERSNDLEITAAAVDIKSDPGRPVLCIAGRSKLDECAALMMAHLLGKHGFNARADGPDVLSTLGVIGLEKEGAAIVLLSYLDTGSVAHMRYAIRRLRRGLPRVKLLLGCWLFDGNKAHLREQVKADTVAASLSEAVSHFLAAHQGRVLVSTRHLPTLY
jgi:predicted PurR-regulated permease PerM